MDKTDRRLRPQHLKKKNGCYGNQKAIRVKTYDVRPNTSQGLQKGAVGDNLAKIVKITYCF